MKNSHKVPRHQNILTMSAWVNARFCAGQQLPGRTKHEGDNNLNQTGENDAVIPSLTMQYKYFMCPQVANNHLKTGIVSTKPTPDMLNSH